MKLDPLQTHVATQWKHESPLICCRFDRRGSALFASAEDSHIYRWDVATGTKVRIGKHDGWVNCLAVSHDDQFVISAGCDGQLSWWPASENPQLASIRSVAAHSGWIRMAVLSPNGQQIATAGNDGLVKLWQVSDGTLVREFRGHEAHVYSVQFHPSGESLVSGDLKGSVKQWNLSDAKVVRTFDAKALHSYNGGQGVDFGGVRSLAFSRDGKLLACGGLHKAENPLGAVHEPLVLVFEWDSQKLVQSHVSEGTKGVAWRVEYHPEGFLMGVSGGSSGGFHLFWKTDQPKEFHKFQLPGLARDSDLHPDGLQVASACYDNHVRLSRMHAKS